MYLPSKSDITAITSSNSESSFAKLVVRGNDEYQLSKKKKNCFNTGCLSTYSCNRCTAESLLHSEINRIGTKALNSVTSLVHTKTSNRFD